jgi:hypothetical protein
MTIATLIFTSWRRARRDRRLAAEPQRVGERELGPMRGLHRYPTWERAVH